ncbi:MarR family transcriptional regulator [Mesorhizobium sp. 1M-11]|uniref:MarR family winged helix-turn-helix transcriptional regulator n=1 Tax=Mesorhizobium sp. 1M-11 TaxID=1529006 RepID=UPI0006C768F9|nr:MarR family transcriptional regulator [Mesorhizobium sp. 1M-11]
MTLSDTDIEKTTESRVQTPRLDRQLCFALYSASGLMTKLYRPLLAPLGLTYPQYLTMLALWERAPRTVGELGDTLGLDPATLTPLLKRMEAGGLISRRRDPADERRVLVQPTAEGEALRAAAGGIQEALGCQLPLEPVELAKLRDTLNGLVGQLRALETEATAVEQGNER